MLGEPKRLQSRAAHATRCAKGRRRHETSRQARTGNGIDVGHRPCGGAGAGVARRLDHAQRLRRCRRDRPAQEKLSDPLDKNEDVDSIDESEADEELQPDSQFKDFDANKEADSSEESDDDDSVKIKRPKDHRDLNSMFIQQAFKNLH